MLKNYIKIAYRNLLRNKGYATINIVGLTLGITCSSLLFLFVIDELSFDTMHSKGDNIYRIIEIDDSGEQRRFFGQTAPPVAKAIIEEYPEVQQATRLYKLGGQYVFSINEDKYAERDYFFAENTIFDVFDFELIQGDTKTALKEPYSMVLTESYAKSLFGTTDNVIGREINAGGDYPNIVTGILKDLPQNSHLQFNLLVAPQYSSDGYKRFVEDWSGYGAYTYVVLDNEASVDQFQAKIPGFVDNHFEPQQQRNFYLQPLSEIHFGSAQIEYSNEDNRGQLSYIYLFIAIGIFMIVIACINYMNLATAKSLQRGKEIGIRKASGAQRGQLITQFLSESVLIAMLSLILAIGLVDVLLPFFNQLTDKQFEFNANTFGGIFMLLFALTAIVGLLAGSYPALLLSKLKAASILKGEMSAGKGSASMRRVLVVAQFTVSIVMILATLVASQQLNYIQSKSLGFNKDQMLVIDINNGDVRRKFETIRSEYAKSPYISAVTVSSRVPGEWKNIRQVYTTLAGSQDSIRFNYIGIDEYMLDAYEIELAQGNNFTGLAQADTLNIIINEAAVKALGLKNPLGAYLELSDERKGRYKVIAVAKDFNFQSLHQQIAPVILGYQSNSFQSIDYFSLKFDPNHVEEVVAHATAVHNAFDQFTPIEYHFLDEQWAIFYKNDLRASHVFKIGAGITILIACLGLFGLASFIIQKRMKEIGVRKVLGASVQNLFFLLSKTFVLQIAIAFCIAAPIAFYFMSSWLNNFAYRIPFSPVLYLLVLVGVLAVALATISIQIWKATHINPVKTLRSE